jgi:hypothetical protein
VFNDLYKQVENKQMSLSVMEQHKAIKTRGICAGTIVKQRGSGDNIKITKISLGSYSYRFDFVNLTKKTYFENVSWANIF